MGFDYSDGQEIEETILELLRQRENLESGARITRDENAWAVRYHLAPERANLIRHLDFTEFDILELGAGMGAVSRFLAEQGRSLTAVEGSARRFAGVEERLRDLDNWSGLVGRIEEYESDRTFDVVCLFGVLEYAQVYVQPPTDFAGDSFDYLLARAARWLKPGGVLLLAIENRLGLKYWSGAGEDHSGGLFDGIVGYPRNSVAQTFSRAELQTRLHRAGLHVGEEYFPFPDYKLPQSVLRGELSEYDPVLAADLACFNEFADHLRQRSRLFPDLLALHHLARAGLFAEFANSFLLAACNESPSPILSRLTGKTGNQNNNGSEAGKTLAWHYSPRRRFPTLTTFHLQGQRQPIEVSKRLSVKATKGQGPQPIEVPMVEGGQVRLYWKPETPRPVATGERLRLRLVGYLYFSQEEEFLTELTAFCAWVIARFSRHKSAKLGGESLDAVVTNATIAVSDATGSGGDAGGGAETFEIFDREWWIEGPMPSSWFVLRNVLSLVGDHGSFNQGLSVQCLADLYREICRRLTIPEAFAADLEREVCLRAAVLSRTPEELRDEIQQALEKPFQPRLLPPRKPGFLEEWAQAIHDMERATHALQEVIDLKDATVESQQEGIDWLSRRVKELETWVAQGGVLEHRDKAIRWLEERLEQEEQSAVSRQEAIQWLESRLVDQQKALDWLQEKVQEGELSAGSMQEQLQALQKQGEEQWQLAESRRQELAELQHRSAATLAERDRKIAEQGALLSRYRESLEIRDSLLATPRHRWVERFYVALVRRPRLYNFVMWLRRIFT